MRVSAILASASALALMVGASAAQAQDSPPHILQQPSISHDQIAFSYGGAIWTVPRAGGRATPRPRWRSCNPLRQPIPARR